MKILNIGYFYPELLNLYGDNGNVEVLTYRAKKYGFEVNVFPITVGTEIGPKTAAEINLVFMGGGPDSSQKAMYDDLTSYKKEFLKNYVDQAGVGLYICGAYQLLGHYYKASDGQVLDGLGIFDLYTESFGEKKPRCIGNTFCVVNQETAADALFPKTQFGEEVVGFENHGGRTYLGAGVKPFAKIQKGHGNNSEDGTEGAIHKNSIGTYFHGPLLSKNPHIADFLIFKALSLTSEEVSNLPKIDDTLCLSAHTASKNLKS